MIKRLSLPNCSSAAQYLVHPVSGSPFNGVHDFGQGVNLHSRFIDEWREDRVNVVRHHHRDTEIKLHSVVVQAAAQHNGPHELRKNPPMLSAKCDEVLPVIALKMRKPSPIKTPSHRD